MHRIVGLFAIGLGACLVAGCGGASLQQVARQDSKELLGDPHPQILRTETVRIVDGAREAVVQMHGRFTIIPNCPMVVAPSKSRCHTLHPRYVVLTFGLPTPSSSQGYSTTSRSQMAAIARARDAQPELAIFPDFNAEVVRCAIPRGGPPRWHHRRYVRDLRPPVQARRAGSVHRALAAEPTLRHPQQGRLDRDAQPRRSRPVDQRDGPAAAALEVAVGVIPEHWPRPLS